MYSKVDDFVSDGSVMIFNNAMKLLFVNTQIITTSIIRIMLRLLECTTQINPNFRMWYSTAAADILLS